MIISTAFAVIPGTDGMPFLGSETLREKLGIDVMASLKSRPEDVGSRSESSLRHVAVTMKGMQAAGKVAAAMEPRDEFVEDVVAQRPAM